MKNILYCTLFLMASTGVYAQTLQQKKVGHEYFISVSNGMQKRFDLNDNASAQYGDDDRQAYMIIIDEEKEALTTTGTGISSADLYFEDAVKNISSAGTLLNKSMESKIKVNMMNAIQTTMEIDQDSDDGTKLKIFYLLTVVEGKGHYYKILCWTLLENKDILLKEFKAISASLKE